jgi:hypothetical protein
MTADWEADWARCGLPGSSEMITLSNLGEFLRRTPCIALPPKVADLFKVVRLPLCNTLPYLHAFFRSLLLLLLLSSSDSAMTSL